MIEIANGCVIRLVNRIVTFRNRRDKRHIDDVSQQRPMMEDPRLAGSLGLLASGSLLLIHLGSRSWLNARFGFHDTPLIPPTTNRSTSSPDRIQWL
jgi:hypothetical protein